MGHRQQLLLVLTLVGCEQVEPKRGGEPGSDVVGRAANGVAHWCAEGHTEEWHDRLEAGEQERDLRPSLGR